MKHLRTLLFFVFAFGAFVSFESCKKEGCTDSDACNYDSDADKDDGSCNYGCLSGGGGGGGGGSSNNCTTGHSGCSSGYPWSCSQSGTCYTTYSACASSGTCSGGSSSSCTTGHSGCSSGYPWSCSQSGTCYTTYSACASSGTCN